MGAKSVAHIVVAGMVTMSRNSTTTVHPLGESAEAGTAAETATAAAPSLVGQRVPVPLRVWVLGLEDGWDLPGRSKANLVEAAKEESVAEFVAERIDHSICIGCREVPF
jgi:hypothetical protein